MPTLVWSGEWPEEFDPYFKKYTKHYFGPNFDWHWFKAQGIAESGLKPKARSSVGAKGIMQILPSTYDDIKKLNPHFLTIDEPRWNIAAGIFYDRYLYMRWTERLPREARVPTTFASYNAGLGRMNKAYRSAQKKGEVRTWSELEPHAPGETRKYVSRIKSLKEEIRSPWD